MKTISTMNEILRTPKHAFRQTEDRPHKAERHRYERRKIKEYLKLRNWQEPDDS